MKKLIKPLIILAVIGAMIAVVASYGMGIYREFMNDYKGNDTYQGEDFILEVPKGASATTIGVLLKEQGVIKYEKAFAQRVKESEYNGQIKYGTYTITKGMTLDDMIALMSAGDDRETLKFTIPEGTQTGTEFTFKGKGVTTVRTKAKGNLYFKVIVETPKNLTEEQKNQMRAFGESLGDKNLAKKKSFWSSVKDFFTK